MASKLVNFAFENAAVRVIANDGDPWFVAKDVATVLGFADPKGAVQKHCKNGTPVRGAKLAPLTQVLDPQTILIPEGDVYRLIIRSNLPSAERFERMIFEEILPSIRKTGRYAAPSQTPDLPDFLDPAAAAEAWAEQYRARAKAERELTDARPKADAHDDFIAADGLFTMQESAAALGLKPLKLFARLRDAGWLNRQNGVGNVPARWVQESDFMRVRPVKIAGQKTRHIQPMVTPSGLAALRTIARDGDLFLMDSSALKKGIKIRGAELVPLGKG